MVRRHQGIQGRQVKVDCHLSHRNWLTMYQVENEWILGDSIQMRMHSRLPEVGALTYPNMTGMFWAVWLSDQFEKLITSRSAKSALLILFFRHIQVIIYLSLSLSQALSVTWVMTLGITFINSQPAPSCVCVCHSVCARVSLTLSLSHWLTHWKTNICTHTHTYTLSFPSLSSSSLPPILWHCDADRLSQMILIMWTMRDVRPSDGAAGEVCRAQPCGKCFEFGVRPAVPPWEQEQHYHAPA